MKYPYKLLISEDGKEDRTVCVVDRTAEVAVANARKSGMNVFSSQPILDDETKAIALAEYERTKHAVIWGVFWGTAVLGIVCGVLLVILAFILSNL